MEKERDDLREEGSHGRGTRRPRQRPRRRSTARRRARGVDRAAGGEAQPRGKERAGQGEDLCWLGYGKGDPSLGMVL